MNASPRIVLTAAAENAALRTKVERAIARERHDRFWLAVQATKQPKAARRFHAGPTSPECAGSTPAARSNVVGIRR